MTTVDFFQNARPFVDAFDAWVTGAKPAARADHLCYKCGSSEEFESLRRMFETESAFIYQSIISDRRIAIVKFNTPVKTRLGGISFLELSDQKPDGSQASGFDHIEIYPTGGTMDALADQLASAGTIFEKVVRPHHTTYDAAIHGTFKVRLESEPLIEKIKRDEMK